MSVSEASIRNSDHFAGRLLGELDGMSALKAVYESQDLSKRVGFDFASLDLVLDRMRDERREVREAVAEGLDKVPDHIYDELTDNIFGPANALRWIGIGDLDAVLCDSAFSFASGQGHDVNTDLSDGLVAAGHVVDRLVASNQDFIDFKWVMRQMETSWKETDAALERNSGDSKDTARLLGDNMFWAVAALRCLGQDPVLSVKANVRKYLGRCKYIEDRLTERDQNWSDIDLDEIYALWTAAKKSGL